MLAKSEAVFSVGDVRVVDLRVHVQLAVRLRQGELALRRRHSQLRRAHVRALPERHRFQIVLAELHRLVFEVAHDFVGFGHRFVAEQLAQAGQRLHARQLGRRDVHLELQQLQS